MNKTPLPEREQANDGLLPEYKFDYSKARPNRFVADAAAKLMIALDPDVAAVFTSQETVNRVLRALIQVMPSSESESTL